MKISCIFFIIFSLSISISAQPSNELVADSLYHIFNNKMNQWMDAYNSGNAENLVPLYTEDADYISSHVPGLVAKGRAQIIEYFQNGINMGGHLDSIQILSMEYSCGLATLFCKYEATNAGQKAVGRNLLVLKKIDNVWLIIEHMTVV